MMWLINKVLTHLPLEKMDAISHRQYFKMHFHEWKVLYFDQNFNQVFSLMPYGPIDNFPALVQIMAWRQLGNEEIN